ncbi:hypothetical protein [Pseudoalteromonas luteoviolacea]|uniref:Uncharacterized protein n=1 Tax=Pseudoalteromonas luteoviolacea DSM 6061 TaxID=1365250 RepID=A0A166WIY5_9GAMM|nr:hypothetical protein [Pseudoalteromonas luteoviolacea]KZN37536.1 hypothetical protein N475_01615 [Pseudoalteromonas luteoviolacea DSM 6061]KZN49562.1 hypothetical protein N474_04705 [Pseudoalteromonas luteoviolacea CPMOR-2]TQF71902.1 hypothetical protein FLM44_12780 [Pseudoalteromonas luteoviolacea]
MKILSTTKHTKLAAQLMLIVVVMVMFIVQPVAKAAMVCSHTVSSTHASMDMHSESVGHQQTMLHNEHMQMTGAMECCETECTCPTTMCAPFSLFSSPVGELYSYRPLTDKPFSRLTGVPQGIISFVYKPPILV